MAGKSLLFVWAVLGVAPLVQAADLLEIYRAAQLQDAVFASARAAHQAGLEKLPQGRAQLLPSVSLTAKRDWDLAAADVILREAGGLLTDATGKPLRYNGPVTIQPSLVAAGPELHTEIITLLNGRAA